MVDKKIIEFRKNKRAQLKIQQMTFMLVAVAFFFILVGVFFLAIRLNNVRQSATNLEQENAMLLVSKLANSPEFSCGNSFGTSMANCIDFDKVMALKNNIETYSDFWGVAKIQIRTIYPSQRNAECNEGNYPNCSIVKILDKNVNTQPAISNFVSLCREDSTTEIMYTKCELAVLLVSPEEKR